MDPPPGLFRPKLMLHIDADNLPHNHSSARKNPVARKMRSRGGEG